MIFMVNVRKFVYTLLMHLDFKLWKSRLELADAKNWELKMSIIQKKIAYPHGPVSVYFD